MSDRTSHVFEGAGAALVKSYTSSVTGETSGFSCQSYERINIYLTTANLVSGGKITLYCDYSHDGETWFPKYVFTSGGTPTADTKVLDSAGSFYTTFDSSGAFFRIRAAHTNGTSLDITSFIIEAKS